MTGGGFGGQADTLYVDVKARTDEKSFRQVEQEAEQAGDRAGSSFGGRFGRGMKAAAGAAALGVGVLAGAAVAAVPALVDMASEAAKAEATTQMFAKTLERFKVPSDVAAKAVEDLSQRLGVAPTIIQEGMTTILRAGGTLEDATRTIEAAGASAAAAGSDIGSAVGNASVAIATGRSELLETAGIITNASDAYKDYAKSIGVKTDALTEAQKIEAFSKAVAKESKYEIEDLSVIMGGYAGATAKNAQAQREFRQVLGELVLPIVSKGTELLTDAARSATTFLKSFQSTGDLKAVSGQVQNFAAQVLPVLRGALDTILPVFKSVFTTMAPIVQSAMNAIVPVVKSLGPAVQATFGLVAQLWKTVLQPTLQALTPVFTLVFNSVAATVRAAIQIVTGVIQAVTALLRGDVPGALDILSRAFQAGATLWARAMQTAGAAILNALRGVPGRVREIAGDIVAGLVRGIRNGVGEVGRAAANLAGGVVSSIKAKLRIQSPSRETEDLGVWAHQGFTRGLWKGVPETQRAAAGLATAALDELAKARDELEKGIRYDAWKAGLADLNDEQLRGAAAAARAAGEQQKYYDVLDEIRQRAGDTADELDRLATAQIDAANSRYTDTQGATDNAFRLSYGADDEGLIKALAATTGLSVAKIRADVEGALNDAKRFAPDAAAVIERVWADQLTHRRTVAADEKRVMDEQLANAVAYADDLRAILAEGIDSDGQARGLITPESLAAMQAELIALDRPLDSMVTWLEDVAQGSDAAAVAAQEWLDTYAASLDVLPRVGATAEEMAADVQASAEQAAQAWDDTNITIDSLNAQIAELREQGRDPMTSGFLDYLDGIIERGGPAADAALAVRNGLILWSEAAVTNAAERAKAAAEAAKIEADGAKLVLEAQEELAEMISGTEVPAWEKRAQVLEQQAQADATHREQLYELADAIRAAGQAADENAAKLNVTLKIAGIDTGLKQLDLYKTAIQGVGDIISGVFEDLVSGTASSTEDILRSMAKMALGIVKQVAVAIVAYQAQAIALALISSASFNFVQAGLALAAAAAVAGIAAGLEARLGQSVGAGGSVPAGGSAAGAPTYSPATAAQQTGAVQIPTSQVTVGAAPEWEARFGGHVDRFGAAVDRVIQQARMPTLPPSGGGATPPVSPLLILTP